VQARGKPPSVYCTITNPTDGATVSDSVTISVDATGTPTITIDGEVVATAYSYNWDTTSYSDGSHAIKATYRNRKDTITVTVDNGGSPPPPPPPDGDGVLNKYAVIAGVSNYIDPSVGDLSYCDDDARDWKSYLSGQGYSIVACLIDRKATERKVADAVADMIAMADADDQIVFASSGHGTVSGGTHVLLYADTFVSESTGDGFVGGVVPDFDFKVWFADSPCPTFIFLDHCNSGGMNEVMKSGIYMTTTCGANGYGYDVPQYQNGAWTYWYLERALDGEGYTTAEDAFDWASSQYPYGGSDAPCEFDQVTGFFTF
jgi:hypothetical protein